MDLLKSTGAVQGEFGAIRDVKQLESYSDEDWLSYWEGIPDRHGITFRRKYGDKLYGHDINLAIRYLRLTNTSPSSVKWIWLRRKNKVLQAISLYRSQQSGKWHFAKDDEDPTNTIPEMDVSVEEVSNLMLRLALSELGWDNFFRDNEIEPYVLFYEDFEDESSWRDTILSILEFLERFRRSHIHIETTFAKSPRANLDEIYETVTREIEGSLPDHPMYKPWLKI